VRKGIPVEVIEIKGRAKRKARLKNEDIKTRQLSTI